jgi:hypothetical protein
LKIAKTGDGVWWQLASLANKIYWLNCILLQESQVHTELRNNYSDHAKSLMASALFPLGEYLAEHGYFQSYDNVTDGIDLNRSVDGVERTIGVIASAISKECVAIETCEGALKALLESVARSLRDIGFVSQLFRSGGLSILPLTLPRPDKPEWISIPVPAGMPRPVQDAVTLWRAPSTPNLPDHDYLNISKFWQSMDDYKRKGVGNLLIQQNTYIDSWASILCAQPVDWKTFRTKLSGANSVLEDIAKLVNADQEKLVSTHFGTKPELTIVAFSCFGSGTLAWRDSKGFMAFVHAMDGGAAKPNFLFWHILCRLGQLFVRKDDLESWQKNVASALCAYDMTKPDLTQSAPRNYLHNQYPDHNLSLELERIRSLDQLDLEREVFRISGKAC